MYGVFTAGRWHRGDGVTCMVFLLQADGTEEMVRHVWCFYYRPMAQGRWCDMYGVFTTGRWHRKDDMTCMVFLLQANGTEEIIGDHMICMVFLW